MIEFRQVTKRYEQQFTALRGVSFALGRGEMAFLTGHSGAGKSTLLKLIMLMERATAGQVLVGGQALEKTPRRRIPYIRRHIGVVFQDHQLLFDRTVFDNVAMPLQVTGVPPNEIGRRVRAALDKVGLLKKEQLNPISLSGGEQQRVGIARAVVNKPPLLLADEPTGNLDPALSSEIMDLFREFSRVGVCVMVATHDIGLIETMAQRTLELSQGELVHDGLPAALETGHG
ncbi:cell division ATP-binding protein FtsE [Halovibrio salipaludis]|uniref:Cell division ATP-binding protein FtsE n=1 Tax=Halovibrio salipaludis TaxID=2032626 RepID=A0A2A2FC21_9GAMM|nr:cell division ATP-binding protein FtsE [Halovibrio salipaludis]PAU82125.1 cell division ATP-binding protein FtsE [Halovibrio salipaludis]